MSIAANRQSSSTGPVLVPTPVAPGKSPWLRWARRAWIALAVAVTVKAFLEPQAHTVYTCFAAGSRDWWSDQTLYDGGFFYGPAFAVAMTPLAVLPDTLGGALWGAGCIALMVYALRRFYREVLPSAKWPAAAEGQFLLLALVGSFRCFWAAQSNALIVALAMLGAVAIVRGRWWRAGLWLALPVHLKAWPLALGGLLGAQWPRRLAGRLALLVMAVGLLPFLTRSAGTVVGQYEGWYRRLSQRETGGLVRFAGLRDVWTIWENVCPPVNPRGYLLLQAFGGLAALGWCLWAGRGASVRQRLVWTLAAWTSWQMLFGPGTERLTYILMAPPLAWGMIASYNARRGRFWITLAFVTTYLFDFAGLEQFAAQFWPPAIALQPCGVLLFVGWLLRYGRHLDLWPVNQSSPKVETLRLAA